MKLEVGMYVRLNCNYELGIGKIIREIDEDNFIKAKFEDDFECSVPMFMISKASNNIIDLIEVGDYVNGYKITSIEEGNHKNRWIYAEDDDGYLIKSIPPKNIKSIVTKEQFEAIKYEVK